MKSLVSGAMSAVMVGGLVLASGAGVAHAESDPRPAVQSSMVNPIEEARSMCTMSKSKDDCAYLMNHTKMHKMVKDCLIKGAIGGAGALVVGRYVSKDVASDIAKKTVVAGATGCLASLA
ncbi:hypothetical protein OG301_20065 [Streptomyces platensis]|uniref:hypothetical protein n=1 Tax=Streptomyces platensis TaxID=58346 RepID=UPI002E143FD4|nr:hypothetical protein OG229_18330 [Streptomyces platensis]WTI53490.1 hypothetical protein OG301_20065 [Streptomyces platensis]WUB80884.1 hypothetical protein OG424_17910 [Streptomyces platensis]